MPDPPVKPVKGPVGVAILGTGSSLVAFHRPSVLALPGKYELKVIMERQMRGRAREICGEGVKVVATLREVCEDEAVDLVVICTPNNTHYEYAKHCLEAGKHVLVEKPLCPTAAEGAALVELAKRKGLVLSVYQNRRWDNDFLTVQKLLRSGRLGEINEFRSSYDRYRPAIPQVDRRTWKETAGEHNESIFSLGSHTIDQAYVLFGKPASVWCRMWDVRGIGVDESFSLEMHYPSDPPARPHPMTVTVSSSVMSPVYPQLRFVLKGARGSYVKYGLDAQLPDLARLARGEEVLAYGEEGEEDWGTLMEVLDVDTGQGSGPALGKAGETEVVVQGEDGVQFRKTRRVPILLSRSAHCRAVRIKTEPGNYLRLYESLFETLASGDRDRLEARPEQCVEVLRIIDAAFLSHRETRLVDV